MPIVAKEPNGNRARIISQHPYFFISFLLLIFLLQTGCSPITRNIQGISTISLPLSPGHSLGQTFTANYAGMNGVDIYVNRVISTSADSALRLTLFQSPADRQPIAQSTLLLKEITQPGYYRFPFTPLSGSNRQDYYFIIEPIGQGQVEVGAGTGSQYLEGALYQDHTPLDYQTSFQLSYDPISLGIGLAQELALLLYQLLIAAFLFILPGWLLSSVLMSDWQEHPWFAKLILAFSFNLALYPVLFLWTALIGIRLGALNAWILPVASIAIFAFQMWRRRGKRDQNRRTFSFHWQDAALVFVIAAVILVRFWVIRTIDAPMWGDSYQHTMIAQLLFEHGGLINSWEPYAPLTTFTYHFGMHAAVAAYMWASGLSAMQATLWMGQFLNVLAVLSPALLTYAVTRSRFAAAVTVLIAGLLLPMPMEYTNWGRYTQLFGQILLPAACWLALHYIDRPSSSKEGRWGMLGMIWITWAGLALGHYRVLAFAIFFLFAIWVFCFQSLRKLVVDTFWVGIGAVILFLPWFLRLFTGQIMSLFGSLTTPVAAVSESVLQYNTFGDIFSYAAPTLWLIALFAAGYGLWARNRAVGIVGFWWLILLVAANPRWLLLPGDGVLSNFAVFIASYLQISILIGGCCAMLLKQTQQRNHSNPYFRRIFPAVVFLIFGILMIWGVRERKNDVRKEPHSLITRADLRAVKWMHENVPEDAGVLINGFLAFSNTRVVGADGGWWLALLGPYKTNIPPLTYGFDLGPDEGYTQRLLDETNLISSQGIASESVIDMLRKQGYQYIYVGQQRGIVNTSQALINAQSLIDSPDFRLVYNQDRVLIFELLSE